MNIKDFQDSLDYLFKAETTAFVWGHAGVGKSSVVRQYAKSKGYHFFPLYLGTQSDLGDILGLADFKRDENGTAVATVFATPIWLKEAIDYCNDNPDSGAIIFLDELNRANRDILQGMFSLALDKTFHTVKLPKNCHVIAAGNPPTSEYHVTDVNDSALMSRFVHIKLEPTVDEFLQYARQSKFEPTLISFIAEQPTLLEDTKEGFDLPVKVDRRSYDRLSRLFQIDTPSHILDQLAYGIIGVERMVAYKLHLKNLEKPLTGEEILKGLKLDQVKTWSNPENIASSILTLCDDNLLELLKAKNANNDTLTTGEMDNLMAYLLVLPKENVFVFVKRAHKMDMAIFLDFIKNKKYEAELIKIIKVSKEITKDE